MISLSEGGASELQTLTPKHHRCYHHPMAVPQGRLTSAQWTETGPGLGFGLWVLMGFARGFP